MIWIILYRSYSDRIVSCIGSIYSDCFTSCVFYVVTGYVYFVSCTSVAILVTCLRCNLSNIFICRTTGISFRFYLFSRSSCRCYIINVYCVDCFNATVICIFCYRRNFRSIFTTNFYSIVQFSFCCIGQINCYIFTSCCCFDILAVISTNYTNA